MGLLRRMGVWAYWGIGNTDFIKESASADSLRKGGKLCVRNVMLLINKGVTGASRGNGKGKMG